jgi:RHS repeat-associated protein
VAYDGLARLTRYRNGVASQTMLYNGMDERIQVVTTPAIGAADTRVYLYDLDHRIVGEYGATGTSDIKAEYIWLMPEVGATGPTGGDDGLGGYMPLATAVGQAGALNWLHTHHHGAPILTTNATGTVVPYPAHAVLGFPGQFANSQQLAGAQHYYNRYRDYDVNTGRYIQADPIGLAGDDNPYAYARGNPLRYVDPTGEAADSVVDAAFILYDLYTLIRDRNCPDKVRTNQAALGADIAGLFIPGFTGAGLAVRGANKASAAVPKVANAKLRNIVNDLYKGAMGPNPIGTGSTADAIRNEIATGLATNGRFHSQKGKEYIRALERWQAKNPDATYYDRVVAESLKNDLLNALGK